MTGKKANILWIAILLSFACQAQFRYSSVLDSVKATGFYRIPVNPELSSYLKTDLSDIRIVDAKKQYVPFIIDIPSGRVAIHDALYDFPIINKTSSGSKTILLIENKETDTLSNFIIQLNSAAAERTASLSGSYNKVDWFVVKDSVLVHSADESDKLSSQQQINFPPSDYNYFRLTINNEKKEPLNILKAQSKHIGGTTTDNGQYYLLNPSPSFSQSDSGSFSLVKITNDRAFHVSSLELGIAKPLLYKRPAKLYTELKAGLQQTWNSPAITTFNISSDNFSVYAFPLIKAQTLYVLIENGDNPPLTIDGVVTRQIERNLMAQLEKGNTYSLLLDDSMATAPTYDLQHFRNKIPDTATILKNKIITAIPQAEIVSKKSKIANWWIWPVIIFAVLLLSLLTWKLSSDVKKTTNNL